MAIITHFLAASEAPVVYNLEELEAFVKELLQEEMVQFPAAILVGEARNIPSFDKYPEYSAYINTYIVPNDPGALLGDLEDQSFSHDLLWYCGADEQAFFDALKQLPLGEHDCCICFAGVHDQLAQQGWEGAVIYALTRPFPMGFIDPIHVDTVLLTDRHLAHYFMLFSSTGGWIDPETHPLEPYLRRYFGPHLLMRWTFSNP